MHLPKLGLLPPCLWLRSFWPVHTWPIWGLRYLQRIIVLYIFNWGVNLTIFMAKFLEWYDFVSKIDPAQVKSPCWCRNHPFFMVLVNLVILSTQWNPIKNHHLSNPYCWWISPRTIPPTIDAQKIPQSKKNRVAISKAMAVWIKYSKHIFTQPRTTG